MITSEELRVAALDASAKRGKWVARRRVLRRWLGWVAWSIVLPVVGLFAVLATLAGLAFWQYMGHDAAYAAAQEWVQQEFGNVQSVTKTTENSTKAANHTETTDRPSSSTSMIPLTDEATPDLQLDRNLTIKNNP